MTSPNFRERDEVQYRNGMAHSREPLYDYGDDATYPVAEPAPPASTFFKEILETLLFTFFVIWFVKTASQNFRIEGASMLPTLHEGQYLIINKLAYFLDEPERGEIIVMHFPNDRSRDFIKRIIGVPGDTVSISNGQVRVNGQLINEPYIKDPPGNNQTWTVPEEHYFVMGDNRRNSSDSRSWSYLPKEDIIGQAWVVYWPPQEWQLVPHYEHAGIPDVQVDSDSINSN